MDCHNASKNLEIKMKPKNNNPKGNNVNINITVQVKNNLQQLKGKKIKNNQQLNKKQQLFKRGPMLSQNRIVNKRCLEKSPIYTLKSKNKNRSTSQKNINSLSSQISQLSQPKSSNTSKSQKTQKKLNSRSIQLIYAIKNKKKSLSNSNSKQKNSLEKHSKLYKKKNKKKSLYNAYRIQNQEHIIFQQNDKSTRRVNKSPLRREIPEHIQKNNEKLKKFMNSKKKKEKISSEKRKHQQKQKKMKIKQQLTKLQKKRKQSLKNFIPKTKKKSEYNISKSNVQQHKIEKPAKYYNLQSFQDQIKIDTRPQLIDRYFAGKASSRDYYWLVHSCIIIQKHWRGHLTRKKLINQINQQNELLQLKKQKLKESIWQDQSSNSIMQLSNQERVVTQRQPQQTIQKSDTRQRKNIRQYLLNYKFECNEPTNSNTFIKDQIVKRQCWPYLQISIDQSNEEFFKKPNKKNSCDVSHISSSTPTQHKSNNMQMKSIIIQNFEQDQSIDMPLQIKPQQKQYIKYISNDIKQNSFQVYTPDRLLDLNHQNYTQSNSQYSSNKRYQQQYRIPPTSPKNYDATINNQKSFVLKITQDDYLHDLFEKKYNTIDENYKKRQTIFKNLFNDKILSPRTYQNKINSLIENVQNQKNKIIQKFQQAKKLKNVINYLKDIDNQYVKNVQIQQSPGSKTIRKQVAALENNTLELFKTIDQNFQQSIQKPQHNKLKGFPSDLKFIISCCTRLSGFIYDENVQMKQFMKNMQQSTIWNNQKLFNFFRIFNDQTQLPIRQQFYYSYYTFLETNQVISRSCFEEFYNSSHFQELFKQDYDLQFCKFEQQAKHLLMIFMECVYDALNQSLEKLKPYGKNGYSILVPEKYRNYINLNLLYLEGQDQNETYFEIFGQTLQKVRDTASCLCGYFSNDEDINQTNNEPEQYIRQKRLALALQKTLVDEEESLKNFSLQQVLVKFQLSQQIFFLDILDEFVKQYIKILYK